jgi:hypothetical protein
MIEDRFPRVALFARNILYIEAPGFGVERELSIAGNFNLDDRAYKRRSARQALLHIL